MVFSKFKFNFPSKVSKKKKKKLEKMNYNEIMNLEADWEFILALYLKFYEGKKVDYIFDENLIRFNSLGDSYKKFIISRLHKVADITTPTSVLATIVTALFAAYTLVGNLITENADDLNSLLIKLGIQGVLIIFFISAYQNDKGYKTKCTFLIELLK